NGRRGAAGHGHRPRLGRWPDRHRRGARPQCPAGDRHRHRPRAHRRSARQCPQGRGGGPGAVRAAGPVQDRHLQGHGPDDVPAAGRQPEAAPAQSQHPGAGRAGRVARLHHGRLGQRPLRKRRGPFAVPVDRAGAGGRHLADRASARPDHTAGAAAFPEDHRHGPARGRAAGGDCGRAARRPPATGAGRRRPADGIPRQGRRRDHGRAGRARQRTRLAGQPPVAAMSPPVKAAAPHAGLSVLDAVAVLVGVVIGIGIFGFPPLVAQHSSSPMMYIALWLAGGGVMLLGALCYAELGSAYPDSGGEYRYLSLAWGARTGLMFAWARCTVIQTGAIAAVAFIYGDYAQQLLDLGRYGAALHAALAVVALTALNIAGTQPTKRLQLVFTALTVTALAAMVVAG